MKKLGLIATTLLSSCTPPAAGRPIEISIAASTLGVEGQVLAAQLRRFEATHPDVRVTVWVTPDAADARHQRFVQWLASGARQPDVLPLDVVWTAELAAAGWLRPLEALDPDFLPGVRAACRWDEATYAVPWFVDVGMLYLRDDVFAEAPESLDALLAGAERARALGYPQPVAWQGARYEGLVTFFVELLGAHGGAILDADGRAAVGAAPALAAARTLRSLLTRGLSPPDVLAWREEDARFAFQNGRAAIMRNWPYAAPLLNDDARSKAAGHFSIAPLPAAPGGQATATLGGAVLALNAAGEHPRAAAALVAFLTAPEQMIERARQAGQYPARASVFAAPGLASAFGVPAARALAVVERATPRPIHPLYTELSQILQVTLHRVISGQAAAEVALPDAQARMQALLDRAGPPAIGRAAPPRGSPLGAMAATAALFVGIFGALCVRRRTGQNLAWLLVLPALATLVTLTVVPLGWTVWTSLHLQDLRTPWRGEPFIGLANYREAVGSERFRGALGRTLMFTFLSVTAELAVGLVLALAVDRARAWRGAFRTAVLIPWAVPAAVGAVIWRLIFVGPLAGEPGWLTDPMWAWVPLIAADTWKTAPFVALLISAGLASIDPAVYEAAAIDGATRAQRLLRITLPLLMPSLAVAATFRTLDALRVFDLVVVLTGGGPGTATEPLALLTYAALFEHLRFGYGSALSLLVFGASFALAMLYVRLLGARLTRGAP